ncbi:hypothetical protein [Chengkuizengella marina]|uniref:Uncharacterized protein n=1 Tax=Chengkuizengella marina TaxID=2507566 RepID=A0A6N9Q5V3_9BACL|nr:hypothetical protein [Chengkuizengella marina]NBI30004.1 hypothetical protein [Chengkuizengella marina]
MKTTIKTLLIFTILMSSFASVALADGKYIEKEFYFTGLIAPDTKDYAEGERSGTLEICSEPRSYVKEIRPGFQSWTTKATYCGWIWS